VGAAAFLLAFFAIWQLRYDLRAYSVWAHFLDPRAATPLLHWLTYDVTTQDVRISTLAGPVPARLYLPVGIAHPPGMVVAHGIHHLGIDEPRLVSFSRAIAGSGFAVLTPQLVSLADYRIESDSIATIGESSAWLEAKLGTGPVTLAGVSFAGGLALLAAGDPRYAPHVRAVFVMGGYDDLNRVARFLVTSQAELPDGRFTPYAAHEYGALVFVYAHLDQFFSPADLPVAREALRFWLWEQPSDAQPWLAKLSPAGRETMDILFPHHVDRLRPQILAAIRADGPELSALSPQGRLGTLRVPVFILHGSTDDVIPSTESLWLEKEVPSPQLGAALITPAFAHVDPEKKVAWYDELRLVHFMARVLRAAS